MDPSRKLGTPSTNPPLLRCSIVAKPRQGSRPGSESGKGVGNDKTTLCAFLTWLGRGLCLRYGPGPHDLFGELAELEVLVLRDLAEEPEGTV